MYIQGSKLPCQVPFEEIGVSREEIGMPCMGIGVTRERIGMPRKGIGVTHEEIGMPRTEIGVSCVFFMVCLIKNEKVAAKNDCLLVITQTKGK
jgi:hypothetical protein